MLDEMGYRWWMMTRCLLGDEIKAIPIDVREGRCGVRRTSDGHHLHIQELAQMHKRTLCDLPGQ